MVAALDDNIICFCGTAGGMVIDAVNICAPIESLPVWGHGRYLQCQIVPSCALNSSFIRSYYPAGMSFHYRNYALLCCTHHSCSFDTAAAFNIVGMPLLVFGVCTCHRGHSPLELGYYL